MLRGALVNTENEVVNVVELPDGWNDEAPAKPERVEGESQTEFDERVAEWREVMATRWQPPDDLKVIEVADDSPVGPGWLLSGNEWIAPKVEQPAPDPLADLITKRGEGKPLTAAEKQRARDAVLEELVAERLGA